MARMFLALVLFASIATEAVAAPRTGPWTKEQAWNWYKAQPWTRGCNYMPASCANRVDQWQELGCEERFEEMERELQVAESIGFNTLRILVELQGFGVWLEEHDGFMERFERCLSIMAKHKMRAIVVLGNDCMRPKSIWQLPKPGPQSCDIGYHGGRKQSQHGSFPGEMGHSQVDDPNLKPKFFVLCEELMTKYRDDGRILFWNVWNEPGASNRGEASVAPMKELFELAWKINPKQPLAADLWMGDYGTNPRAKNKAQYLAGQLSDIVSYHCYGDYETQIRVIRLVRRHFGRPMINTEWLARIKHNDVFSAYPLYYIENIGCTCWGFVAGKYQTYEPWEMMWKEVEKGTELGKSYDMTKWFHDLYRPSLRPYDPKEIDLIKRFNKLADEDFKTGGLSATAVVTSTNGVERTLTLSPTAQPDGGLRFTVRAVDAQDAKWVDIHVGCATAKTGEDGYWLSQRGLLGRFTRESGNWKSSRDWVTLPYFGMKTLRGSFLAVMEGMRFEFDVCLDIANGVHRLYPRWRVAETGTGAYEDMSVVVYPLAEGAGYNEMAKAYRRYKNARDPEIRSIKERAKTRPHLLKLARSVTVRQQCAAKPFDRKTDAIDFTPETEHPVKCKCSFADVLANLRKMKALGLDDISVCVAGWQTGGYDGRAPAVFPVAPEAGGEDGLRRLIKGAQELGYIIDAQDNYTDCYTVSPLWDNGGVACLGLDGKLDYNGSWCGGKAYNLCLKNAWDVQGFMPRDLKRTAGLGYWGCHYIDVFTAAFPYRCLNPAHAANRNEQMQYQIRAAKLCRELFGGFSSECCFDHLVGYVDYINYATAMMRNERRIRAEGKKSLVDKIVPFWELAFHDVVLSNPDKVTQEVLEQPENLILVEFGGRPIFYHFGDDNIPGIKKAYDQFLGVRHLQLEEMVRHDELAEGFVRVRYGNGDAIYVNHTDKPQTADGVTVPAMDFKLVNNKSATNN